MDHHRRGGIRIPHISPAIVVEFLDESHVVAPVGGFVEELDGGYDVGVGFVAVG